MAQLLIKAQQTASGPGSYLRGHVVGVFPDSHVFGAREGLPRFLVLEVPDDVHDDHPELSEPENDAGDPSVMVRRRKWQVDIDDLPPGILVALEASGRTNIARGVLNGIVKADSRIAALSAGVPSQGNGKGKGRGRGNADR